MAAKSSQPEKSYGRTHKRETGDMHRERERDRNKSRELLNMN